MVTTSEHGGNGREEPVPAEDPIVAEARRIFALQQRHRWQVASSTAAERAAKLERLRVTIEAHREALHRAMYSDFHKPALEVDLSELNPVLVELDHTRKNLRGWMKTRRVSTPLLLTGTRSEIRYEPKGVVLIMAPWNYPFGLIMAPLVAAIAAGNCVILRPSEKVPATAAVITSVIRQAFDESEVACLTEPGVALATALLELPFDHVFFTGSTRIGRLVMAAAAKHLASVTLELGGKSPAVIDETADLDATAERIIWGKSLNAGQTCIAPDYVLVHESRREAFVEAAQRALSRFYGATEAERRASPHFPRVIDDGAFERLSRLLSESVRAGARVAVGGEVDEGERYIAPTILTGVTWETPVMGEEIFGPLLPVLTYRTLDEVVDQIRRHGKPLALYVFSRSARAIESVVSRTSSGGVAVNNVLLHYVNPDLPFGGVGESGLGSYHGEFGFKTFSHERAVLAQRRGNMLRPFYPPYTEGKQRLFGMVTRWLG